MHKFIPTNTNRNSHVLVAEYNWPIEEYLRGYAILLYINNLNDIVSISSHLDDSTKIAGFVYINDFASLETIDVDPNWGQTPIYLYINRLGLFRNVHEKIALLRTMNVVLIFTGSERQAITDAQITASLGIHSGIKISDSSPLGEDILDLITYSFYEEMPHAEIEPFSTIERYYDGESYVSPILAEFVNPQRYIFVDKNLNLALSKKELNNGEYVGVGLHSLYTEEFRSKIRQAGMKWQEMFINSHPCTFCPAFRICLGYFAKRQENDSCKRVMSELLEAIEFYKKRNQQNYKERCQP